MKLREERILVFIMIFWSKKIRLVNKIIFLEDEINLLNQKLFVYEQDIDKMKTDIEKNDGSLNRPGKKEKA